MGRAIRRGPWLPEEDEALLHLVHQEGPNNWVRISEYMQHRSPTQCRYRYYQDLRTRLLKPVVQSSLTDTSTVDAETNSALSSRAGNTQYLPVCPAMYVCGSCSTRCATEGSLKFHMNIHLFDAQRYGCVVDACYESFGNEDDWELHDRTIHPEQAECYRCDGSYRRPDGSVCFAVFYAGIHERPEYLKHLLQAGINDPNDRTKQAKRNRIDRNNQGQFWCGFCERAIWVTRKEQQMGSLRIIHLREHFRNGSRAVDWTALDGNGRRKADILRILVSGPGTDVEDNPPSPVHEVNVIDDAQRTSQQHRNPDRTPQLTSWPDPVKVEDEEMIDLHLLPSSALHADLTRGSSKVEPELKYFSIEVSLVPEVAWVEPRYSVEPRYVDESRATDELLRVGHVRMSDEPIRVDESRRTDELRDARADQSQSRQALDLLGMRNVREDIFQCEHPYCARFDAGLILYSTEYDAWRHVIVHHRTEVGLELVRQRRLASLDMPNFYLEISHFVEIFRS